MNRDEDRRTQAAGGERDGREGRESRAASGWQSSPKTTAQENAGEGAASTGQSEESAGEAVDVNALRQENAELKDRVLRLMAEMDNLRKRLEREKEEAVKYAAAQFARDMLSVADNLTRALQAVPAEKRGGDGDGFLKSLVDGVEMTLKDLLNIFERHNIRKIESHGRKFDPNLHEAMFEVTDTDADTGTIVQVVQEGYTHHDRVLRPAMVGVARREGEGNNAGERGAAATGAAGESTEQNSGE